MSRRIILPLAFAALALAPPARAHHGVAAVGLSAAEGPGAAFDTTSALPLPQGTLFTMARTELVRFRQRGFAEPENKDHSSFTTLGAGWGVTPWLSAYVFLPYAVKAQDAVGTSRGFGDPSVLLAAAFKLDEGTLKLVPERESLDELRDWHFSVWGSSTLPLASVSRRDAAGAHFAPDMQSGFGSASPAVGVTALKQLTDRLTALAEVSYQHFYPHRYDFTEYRFGGETRVNAAAVWELFGRGRYRLDLAGELNGLHLQRDRERSEAGGMEPLEASGGAILYAGAGLRFTAGAFSAGLSAKRAALKDLNEGADQQGAEGLEQFRAALTLGWSTSF